MFQVSLAWWWLGIYGCWDTGTQVHLYVPSDNFQSVLATSRGSEFCKHTHTQQMVKACTIVPRIVNVVAVLELQAVSGVLIWYKFRYS